MGATLGLGRTYFSVNVAETDQNRGYWASRAGLAPSTVAKIRAADILLVPWEGRAGVDLSFPNGTTEFFALLSSGLDGKKIAVAIEPEGYRELALHANEVRWPSILVTSVLLPTLSTVLAGEIERLIKSPSPTTSIELAVNVENESGRCVSINYKGEPDRLIETLVQETNRCFASPNPTRSANDAKAPRRKFKGKAKSHR
jgi:hypothetical protein